MAVRGVAANGVVAVVGAVAVRGDAAKGEVAVIGAVAVGGKVAANGEVPVRSGVLLGAVAVGARLGTVRRMMAGTVGRSAVVGVPAVVVVPSAVVVVVVVVVDIVGLRAVLHAALRCAVQGYVCAARAVDCRAARRRGASEYKAWIES